MDSLLDNHYVDREHLSFEKSTLSLNSSSPLEMRNLVQMESRQTQSMDKINLGNHYLCTEPLPFKG